MNSYVESKTGGKKEQKVKDEEEMLRKRNPTAKDALKDVLKDISMMSRQDWLNIPDAHNSHKRVENLDLLRLKEKRNTHLCQTV